MRILVEPSDYILRNAGDTAMLQTAVVRLAKLWPQGTIQVLSDVPDLLPAFCPNAVPLDTKGRRIWFDNGFLLGRFSYYLSERVRMRVWEWECYLRRSWPSLVEFILKTRLKLSRQDTKDLKNFLEAVSQADLVIATGMGGITDAFPDYASELLDTLRLGIGRGAVTAMMGQGIGPLQDPKLRSQAQEVLPRINFISLREERASRPILYSLGVSPERITTTGDDAIEMAYQLHAQELGCGLGINLRAANYSDVDQNLIEQLRPILQDVAKKHQAPTISIPISRIPGEADADAIRQLIAGYDDLSDGGTELDTPLKVIEQVKRCRVVVTGSYHAGVFALSLGIPVVGLAKSAYYVDKFLGLAQQFGTGCDVVLLNDTDWQAKLRNAIERAWQSAEQIKPELLAAAERQIDLGHAAYRKLYALASKSSGVSDQEKLKQEKLVLGSK
jgi:polysaccharide pyruvyl transferase WcaK-like protein